MALITDIEPLTRSEVFRGLCAAEIESALQCIGATARTYKKGAAVLKEGDTADSVCIVTEGEIIIQKTDYNGNANIVARQYPPQMFAGASAFTENKQVPFDAVCASDSTVLFLSCDKIVRMCPSACGFHTRIIRNLLSAVAEKNAALSNKIAVLTKRTIREKVLEFLHGEAKRGGGSCVTLSMSRSSTADFLSVDRAALSRELSAMKRDGLISFSQNKFYLL